MERVRRFRASFDPYVGENPAHAGILFQLRNSPSVNPWRGITWIMPEALRFGTTYDFEIVVRATPIEEA